MIYTCESNASRQYDERRDLEAAENALNELRLQDEEDPMKFLEARTFESRREMDILDALGNILEANKIQGKVNFREVMEKVMEKRKNEEIAQKNKEKKEVTEEDVKLGFVKRIDEDEAEVEVRERVINKNIVKKRKSCFKHAPKFIIKKLII